MFNSTTTIKTMFCVLLLGAFCNISHAQLSGQMTIRYWDTLSTAQQQQVTNDLATIQSYYDTAYSWYNYHYNNYMQSGNASEYQSMDAAGRDIQRFADDYNRLYSLIGQSLQVTLVDDPNHQYPGVPRLRWDENVHDYLARHPELFGRTSRITIAFNAGGGPARPGPGNIRGGGGGGNGGGSTGGGGTGTGVINWDDINLGGAGGASEGGSIMGQ